MATSQKGATEVATGADPSRGRSDDQEEDVQSENHPTAPKSRQAYKQRDMYRALDGSALLALGELNERQSANSRLSGRRTHCERVATCRLCILDHLAADRLIPPSMRRPTYHQRDRHSKLTFRRDLV